MKKVKTITGYTTLNGTNPDETRYKSSYTEYDKAGNETLLVTYFDNGEIENKTVQKFDANGHRIEEINYISEDEISDKKTFTRNEKGKLTEQTIAYADGSESIKKYTHEDDDKLVSIITKDDEGNLEEKEIVKLNEAGNIIERRVFDDEDQLVEKQVNEYNEHQHVIKRTETNEQGNIIERTFTYNEKQNMIKRISTTGDKKLIDLIKLTYDDKDRVTEQEIANTYIMKYEYNDEENSVKEERYLPNGMMDYQSVAFYDEDDLLIEDQKPLSITKYEYEFFE